tara:strand:- start:27 stop:842 length:816 start_codon:yes stop_codon:yes gene_type:complete
MLFKYVAGNKLKHAILKSQKIIKNNKIPILNYICENVKPNEEKKIYLEYSKILNNINSNYMIALKLSSLNFNETLINKIVENISQKNIKLIIDAEDNEYINNYRKITNELIKKYNGDRVNIIKTYQMYRKDSLDELKDDINYFGKNIFNNNVFLSSKLVRGAYWNSENKEGHLFLKKEDTNMSYNNGILECYNSIENKFIVATHNKNSIELVSNLKNNNNIILAHLMGMNETNMKTIHLNRATYIPYGPYREMIPYLSRRLYENIDQIKHM